MQGSDKRKFVADFHTESEGFDSRASQWSLMLTASMTLSCLGQKHQQNEVCVKFDALTNSDVVKYQSFK